MDNIRHVIGIDISTQTVSAILTGIAEKGGMPDELIISGAWIASIPYKSEAGRRNPAEWVDLVRECINNLRYKSKEVELAEAIGVSTTFPGTFPVSLSDEINPGLVNLYDNTEGAEIFEYTDDLLAGAESAAMNRMGPGNMVMGLIRLIKSCGLNLSNTAAVVPPNSAFCHALLKSAGCSVNPKNLFSDFTETVIGGLYNAGDFSPMPDAVKMLFDAALPEVNTDSIKSLLPKAMPAWKNILPPEAAADVRELLELPNLISVSIGGGDSSLGALALYPDSDTILNVRGSSDSPMMAVQSTRPRTSPRENLLHYPAATAKDPESPWLVVAPMLRSGKVWDWVKGLRFDRFDGNGNIELEKMAMLALKQKLRSPQNSPLKKLRFNTALGGERAPHWDPSATGSIMGLTEKHGIGDIALAALESMSATLGECLSLMEERYEKSPGKLILAGGPVCNHLWNWITQIYTGKKTYATTFSDASLLGAAMIGYASVYDETYSPSSIAKKLNTLSGLAWQHPLIKPVPVTAPDNELLAMEINYKAQQ